VILQANTISSIDCWSRLFFSVKNWNKFWGSYWIDIKPWSRCWIQQGNCSKNWRQNI